MLHFIFNIKKEKPKENIIFAKKEVHNVPNIKHEPNFNKIAKAFEEDEPKTVCMDYCTTSDIIEKAEIIEHFFAYNYEFEPDNVKYIEEKLEIIFNKIKALADYVEDTAIEV